RKLISDTLSKYYSNDKFKQAYNSVISIHVDMHQKIKNVKKTFYNAFPIILKNIEADTLAIFYCLYLLIIMEAKYSNNTWKKIEDPIKWICIPIYDKIILPPGEIALSSAIIYHGNYSTDLRLKMGHNYSNVFKGNINYNMFKNE